MCLNTHIYSQCIFLDGIRLSDQTHHECVCVCTCRTVLRACWDIHSLREHNSSYSAQGKGCTTLSPPLKPQASPLLFKHRHTQVGQNSWNSRASSEPQDIHAKINFLLSNMHARTCVVCPGILPIACFGACNHVAYRIEMNSDVKMNRSASASLLVI